MRDKEVAHFTSRAEGTLRLTIDDLRLTIHGRGGCATRCSGPRLRFGFGCLGCLGALAVLFCAGCSAKYWTGVDTPITKIKLNPVKYQLELENSKDVDVDATDVELKHNGTELKLGRLKLTDTASGVRRANVDQINAVASAQMTQVAYLKQAGENLNGAIGELRDVIKVAAPGGIAGVARERMDAFWYFALAAAAALAGVMLWRKR